MEENEELEEGGRKMRREGRAGRKIVREKWKNRNGREWKRGSSRKETVKKEKREERKRKGE